MVAPVAGAEADPAAGGTETADSRFFQLGLTAEKDLHHVPGAKPLLSFPPEARALWERGWDRLSEPGLWIVFVLVAGALPRFLWVIASEGTADAIVWEALVRDVHERGMIAVYQGGDHILNHPPMAVWLTGGLHSLGLALDQPFALVFRMPLLIGDLVTFGGIVWLFGASTHSKWRQARWAIASFWWLSPVVMVLSSFHGNTDSLVAMGLVLAAGAVAHQRYALAGLIIGLGLWIKIPGILAAPLLWFAVPHTAGRIRMATIAALTATAGYLPWLILDPSAVIESVFFYPGLRIQTTTGMPIWGLERFFPDWRAIPIEWRSEYRQWMIGWLQANRWICLIPIVILAIVRRGRNEATELAAGIAATYAILYGLSNLWGFQYLAWSAPFWLALGPRWGVAATVLTSVYVYGLYAWLCHSWLLLGPWNFAAQPDWPLFLRAARDGSILFFATTALWQITTALREESRRWNPHSPLRAGQSEATPSEQD